MIPLLSRHLFESSLFCILVGGLACCLRRHAAAARHVVWLVGISKFAIPTLLLAATGARIAYILPAASWASSLAIKSSALLSGIFGFLPSSAMASELTAGRRVILFIWALGTAAMVLTWFIQLMKRRAGLTLPADAERETLERAKRRLGGVLSVRLRCSAAATEPALLGIFRSTVTIPQGLASRLSASELESVFVHELAHARRRDNLAASFVHALVCIFWFHPLLWFVEKRLVAEREHACDEMVISSGTAPRVYVTGILKVCRFHLFESVAGVSAIAGSDLKVRLDLILSGQARRPIPYPARLLLAALALFMTVLPVASGYCEQCVFNGQSTLRKSPELAFSIPGQGERLLSQYRGKVVGLEFILTTCQHCQAASKIMTGMQEQYGSRGFQALDVAINPNADLLLKTLPKTTRWASPSAGRPSIR